MGELLTALSILAGASALAIQLYLQRRWDKGKSTEEICNRFIEPDMYKHWNSIQTTVVEHRKKWDDLSDEQQESVRMLLSYFETIGILVRRRVVDSRIVLDLFDEIISLLFECTSSFLPRLRAIRRSEYIYCEFEALANLARRHTAARRHLSTSQRAEEKPCQK
jgi:hypothetical protein